ncbi:hypothetical protein FHT00_000103 [Sphingomonas insulae]|nr:hypothetical protein [Sphingomonas insulae]NIJ28175.1 hypothetical protein [Sphingomonas insulae]
MHFRKDRSLDELARVGNVAQFVSFAPEADVPPSQTYSRVAGYDENHKFASVSDAAVALLEAAPDRKVNVRSYAPESPRSREFVYGLERVEDVLANVKRLTREGLHVIVNETVDIEDGGVSGVVQSGVIEFAPDDTPRCVEKPGVASLPLDLGLRLLETVYGFRPELGTGSGRTEFSLHPKPRGWKQSRTLLWEYEEGEKDEAMPTMVWPNRFSRHVGDKTYGLLMAHLMGLPVPDTLAICRRLAPFRFGKKTGGRETWIRTCPKEPEPGLFTTHKGWLDPFRLMMEEDPTGERISAVLAQQAVDAQFSGAAVAGADGTLFIEGIAGEGDVFMLGRRAQEHLPDVIRRDVVARNNQAVSLFGPVRLEWVHDGSTAWIVQMHRGNTVSEATAIVPGERDTWVEFEISSGLEALRAFLPTIDAATGLIIVGEVGMTSHVADLVRKAGVPTRVRSARAMD